MNQEFMKDKPVFKLVLTMSFPMVLSMLVNALYNIIDSYFVAKVSEDAMTALSLIFPVQNLVIAVGVGFGIGINAMVAFYLGAKQLNEANCAVSQGIILNLFHGIILTLICITMIPSFLGIFTTNSQIINHGISYSNIVFSFAVVQTVGVSFEKIFQAVGKMKISMVCMLLGCVINIILDPVMIFGIGFVPAMGIRGAAIATVIGQFATLLAYILFFYFSKLPISLNLNLKVWKESIYLKMYSIGIPATLNMALPSLLITILNGILAEFSQIYVLILGIYYKLQTFIYLTANGVVQGIRPLVGYNYGAGRKDRVRRIFYTALLLCIIIMSAGMALCILFPQKLMGLFVTDTNIIAEGSRALKIISYGFILSSFSVIVSGTYEGLGRGLPSLIISSVRYIAIIPIAYILSTIFNVVGVWSAFYVTEAIAALIAIVMFYFSSQRLLNKS